MPSAKAAVERMERLSGVRLPESQGRRAMQRLGMSLKKAAPLPGRADEPLPLNFHAQEMTPRLAQATKGNRKVFFVKRRLTNRCHPTCADFRQAIDPCLDDLASPVSDQLLSVLFLNFQFYSFPEK